MKNFVLIIIDIFVNYTLEIGTGQSWYRVGKYLPYLCFLGLIFSVSLSSSSGRGSWCWEGCNSDNSSQYDHTLLFVLFLFPMLLLFFFFFGDMANHSLTNIVMSWLVRLWNLSLLFFFFGDRSCGCWDYCEGDNNTKVIGGSRFEIVAWW